MLGLAAVFSLYMFHQFLNLFESSMAFTTLENLVLGTFRRVLFTMWRRAVGRGHQQ